MKLELVGAPYNGQGALPWWLSLNRILLEVANNKTGDGFLKINQNGLQNRNIARSIKEQFKKEIVPELVNLTQVDHPLTGTLHYHLAEGVLRKAYIDFFCTEGHEIVTPF